MSVTVNSAERAPLSLLTLLWNEGFSDYYVPMQLRPDRFGALIERESISLADSFVALDEGEPVGFVLTGLRFQAGRVVGFDGGTAILPSARGKGIGKLLMQRFVDHLQTVGVELAVLTVVSKNQNAIGLYKRLGFSSIRELVCMRSIMVDPLVRSGVPGLLIRKVLPIEVGHLATDCYLRRPEWQNDESSYKLQHASALVAELGGRTVGYAIYQEAQPVLLHQLGVLPEYRKRGIGSHLLQAVLRESETAKVSYLNHPREEIAGTKFLHHRGFEPFLEQVEMHRELEPKWRPRQADQRDVSLIKQALQAAHLPIAGVDEYYPNFWILEDGEESLQGTVGAEVHGEAALLRSLTVREDVRGQGLGKRLASHAERYLYSQGVRDVYIVTTTADAMFSRLGYMRVTRSDVPAEVFTSSQFQGACPLTAVVMHKPLV